MKILKALIVLPIFSISLYLGCGGGNEGNGNTVTNMGGSEVWGTLVDPGGTPLDSVQVRAVPLPLDNPDIDNAVDTVYTDARGKYEFNDLGLPPTTLNIYGIYGDSQYVVFIPNVDYESNVENDVGVDTMYAPGRIAGYVLTEETDNSGTVCYIPGTSFAAWTDSTGYFMIFAAPPGLQTIYFDRDNYLRREQTILVTTGDTAFTDTVILEYDTSYIPVPRGLSASYDTLTGTATVWWNPVSVADLEGYHLYLDQGSPFKINSSIITDTFYTYTIFSDLTDTTSLELKIQVAAEDSFNNIGDLSRPIDVHATSPTKVQTFFTFSVLDMPSVEDTVRIVVRYQNATRTNTQISWYVDNPDSVVREIPISTMEGYDTLSYVWPDSGTKCVYISALDDGGISWNDTVLISIFDIRPTNFWESGAALGESRRFVACGVLDSVLYAIGGCYDLPSLQVHNSALKTVETLNSGSGQWLAGGALNFARWDHGVGVVNGKLYVIGGRTFNELLNTIEEYDPVQDTFAVIDTLPYRRSGFAVTSWNNKLYLLGGLVFNNGELKLSASIDEYDPVTKTFTNLGNMLMPRSNHQAVVIDGEIYIIGGIGGDENLRSFLTVPQNSMEIYDLDSNSCEISVSMNLPRYSFAAAAIYGKIYVFGGSISQTENQVTDKVEEFDPLTNTWIEKSPLPVSRQGMGIGIIDNRIYLVGGTENGIPPSGQTDIVDIYYP